MVNAMGSSGFLTWFGTAALLLAAACSGASSATPDDGGEGGGDAGGATTSTSAGGAGAGPATQTWKAGFLAETEPGQGPAALSFFNDSTAIMSGVVRETTFWQIAPGTTEPWQLAISADVQADATLGYHESFSPQAPCSFLQVTVSGVSELQPGQGYLYRVFDDGNTYGGEITEDAAPPPFVGLRAYVGSPLPAGSKLSLTVDGSSEPVVFDLLQSETTVYSRVDLEAASITDLILSSPNGDQHVGQADVVLEGAPGFTIYLGFSPPDEATGLTVLSPQD